MTQRLKSRIIYLTYFSYRFPNSYIFFQIYLWTFLHLKHLHLNTKQPISSWEARDGVEIWKKQGYSLDMLFNIWQKYKVGFPTWNVWRKMEAKTCKWIIICFVAFILSQSNLYKSRISISASVFIHCKLKIKGYLMVLIPKQSFVNGLVSLNAIALLYFGPFVGHF